MRRCFNTDGDETAKAGRSLRTTIGGSELRRWYLSPEGAKMKSPIRKLARCGCAAGCLQIDSNTAIAFDRAHPGNSSDITVPGIGLRSTSPIQRMANNARFRVQAANAARSVAALRRCPQ